MQKKKIHALRKSILNWYKKHGRDLPWRHTRDPYKILVAEIMLQQTQVDRVIEKYHSFLRRFPAVQKLARARASSVIKEWAGLGYNRRALYLQKAAQAVIKNYGGIFPNDLEALKTLPGIGDYTARAILSFAFEEKVPMMDTNHRKFYARVLYKGEIRPDAELLVGAEDLIGGLRRKQVHNWNQALMDLMSAVGRKERSAFVENFDKKYPLKKPAQGGAALGGKSVPFKNTDRYVRGRIVDALRDEQKISVAKLRSNFPHIDDARFGSIINKLAKDGLIRRIKRSIVLP